MSQLSTYAANGNRLIDSSHGNIVGKFRGGVFSEGATITLMEVNNVAGDAKASFGLDVPIFNTLFMMKEGAIISSITMLSGSFMAING